jgi:hypothetical protein
MEKPHRRIYSTKYTPVKNHPKMAYFSGFSSARLIFPAEYGFPAGDELQIHRGIVYGMRSTRRLPAITN